MYLIDTNIIIYAIKNTYPSLNAKLLKIITDDICISAVTIGELEYGIAKSHWGERNKRITKTFIANFNILPFDAQDAICFGKIRNFLTKRGAPIGYYDLMIASQAVAKKLTLITHNTREFCRVPNLLVEDWTEEESL